MGTWLVPADLLARSRFLISPLQETVAALRLLSGSEPADTPWERSFRGTHAEAYEELLSGDPVLRALAAHLWRRRRGAVPGWIADFLSVPPLGPETTFADELGQLTAWDDERMRAHLLSLLPGPLPETLQRPGLQGALNELLSWVWTATIASDWPRRRRVLEADVVSRTRRLATQGWASVVPTLGNLIDWRRGGHLQINSYDLPTLDLAEASELSFVPVHTNRSWVAWELPRRFAVIYPVAGAQVAEDRPSGHGLDRLVGPNRARLLGLLDEPHSTTQLVALTGLPLGAVGNHLRVLLDAGAVFRRRSGREVLYWRTQLGDGLVAAGR